MTRIVENSLFSEEIPENGACKGHIRFASSSVAPQDVEVMAFCANITASILFERMQAQGTNVIITLDGGSRIDVLARFEDDGVDLLWKPKDAAPGSLDEVRERLRGKTFYLESKAGDAKNDAPKEAIPPSTRGETAALAPAPAPDTAPSYDADSSAEEDYLTKQLHRIP